MFNFNEYREPYFSLLKEIKESITAGRWRGMEISIGNTKEGEFFLSTSFVIANMDGFDYEIGDRDLGEFYLAGGYPTASTTSLYSQKIHDSQAVKGSIDDCRIKLFAWLDACYESKEYLTGKDYANYKLNPDIIVDDKGALYNAKSQVLLKFLNPAIEEYWIKEGTLAVESNAFKGMSNLKTLVIPASITDLCPFYFDNCTGLTKLVVENKELPFLNSIFYTLSRNTKDFCLYLPDIKGCTLGVRAIAQYNEEKLREGIIEALPILKEETSNSSPLFVEFLKRKRMSANTQNNESDDKQK